MRMYERQVDLDSTAVKSENVPSGSSTLETVPPSTLEYMCDKCGKNFGNKESFRVSYTLTEFILIFYKIFFIFSHINFNRNVFITETSTQASQKRKFLYESKKTFSKS